MKLMLSFESGDFEVIGEVEPGEGRDSIVQKVADYLNAANAKAVEEIGEENFNYINPPWTLDNLRVDGNAFSEAGLNIRDEDHFHALVIAR
jgi:hypothetical protein